LQRHKDHACGRLRLQVGNFVLVNVDLRQRSRRGRRRIRRLKRVVQKPRPHSLVRDMLHDNHRHPANIDRDTFVLKPLAQVNIDEDEIADLQAQSPTGVIFVPLQAARVRDLPTTEGSEVIASLNVNQVVNVIGRLEDSSWLQIDYSGEPAWVAVFLGQVVGDLGVVPVVDLEAEAETGD
jgi:hypothetical protein